jgi:hypothetical protein
MCGEACDAGGVERDRVDPRARGAVAELCMIRDGRIVVDEPVGRERNALFWIFSQESHASRF